MPATTKAVTKAVTKAAKKSRSKKGQQASQFNVFPTERQARAAEREAKTIRALSDLSTLKHPHGPREANFELFEARQALVESGSGRWTYKEAGNLLLMKKFVEKGKFSDFPGLHQQDGIAITKALMEWQQALAAQQQSE